MTSGHDKRTLNNLGAWDSRIQEFRIQDSRKQLPKGLPLQDLGLQIKVIIYLGYSTPGYTADSRIQDSRYNTPYVYRTPGCRTQGYWTPGYRTQLDRGIQETWDPE